MERGGGEGGRDVGGWREALKIWAYILLFLVLAEGRGCVGRPRWRLGVCRGELHVDVGKTKDAKPPSGLEIFNKNLVITFL